MAIHQLVECKRQINGKLAKEGTAQNGIERDRKEQREYRVEQAGRQAGADYNGLTSQQLS